MSEHIRQARKKMDPGQQHAPAQRQSAVQSQPQSHIAQLAQQDSVDLRPQFADQRQQTRQLKAYSHMMQNSPRATQLRAMQHLMNQAVLQKAEGEELLQEKSVDHSTTQLAEQSNTQPNNTGLPHQLKAGIESLSGMSMDHVRVNYNSGKPAQLNAHAYAQGSEIHVAPGQERHVPHEAWHVVQQAQGRVRPTMQMKQGVPVNDDAGLETEADVMGAKALGVGAAIGGQVSQRMGLDSNEDKGSVTQQLPISDNSFMPIQRYATKDIDGVLHVYFDAQLIGECSLRTCGLTLNILSETSARNVIMGDISDPASLVQECLFRDKGEAIPTSPGTIFHFGNLLTYESGKSRFVNLGAIKYPGKPKTGDVEAEIDRFITEDLNGVAYANRQKSHVLAKLQNKEISLAQGKIELIRNIIANFIYEAEDQKGYAFASKYASLPIFSGESSLGYLINLALRFACSRLADLLMTVGVPLNTFWAGRSVLACAAEHRNNEPIVKILLTKGFHLQELIALGGIDPYFQAMARCAVLGPHIQHYESAFGRILGRSYIDLIAVNPGMPPDILKIAVNKMLRRKIDECKEMLLRDIVDGAGFVAADIEQIRNSVLPYFETDQSSEIKFFAHLFDAKGVIEGGLVNLEGMLSEHAMLQYALGMMSAVNKDPEKAEALIPILIQILKSMERSIDLRFIQICFGDFGTTSRMIGAMLPLMKSEVSKGQGLLLSSGWDAPKGEKTGHSLYLTVPSKADVATIHNRGGGSERHQVNYEHTSVYPYVVDMGKRDLFAWISDLLESGIQGNKAGVLEKLYTDAPLELSASFTPQLSQLVGNCSVANLESALLGMLEVRYRGEAVSIFNYVQKSVRAYAEHVVRENPMTPMVKGTFGAAWSRKIKAALLEKNGPEIVTLVNSGGSPSLEIFKEKQTWISLALLLKAEKTEALTALKMAGVPAKELLENEMKTLFRNVPEVISNVLAFFYPG
ncbi:DUF4157 domain-containing protein [Undibacterium sp. Ji49W]|uniref:eCIS core domain-containing protein n=1 Tax=Undibacterium sp. Ji49W TaxID=3413040 RepID=UPI003BF24228